VYCRNQESTVLKGTAVSAKKIEVCEAVLTISSLGLQCPYEPSVKLVHAFWTLETNQSLVASLAALIAGALSQVEAINRTHDRVYDSVFHPVKSRRRLTRRLGSQSLLRIGSILWHPARKQQQYLRSGVSVNRHWPIQLRPFGRNILVIARIQ